MGNTHILSAFYAALLSLPAFAAIGPVTDLVIFNGNIAPDGYERAAVLVDGVFPGPVIAGKKGDRFQINVIDMLTNHTMLKTTSVVSVCCYCVNLDVLFTSWQHWHGIDQKQTNWADGAASVNQCPIAPGHSFLYDFNVVDQAGENGPWCSLAQLTDLSDRYILVP